MKKLFTSILALMMCSMFVIGQGVYTVGGTMTLPNGAGAEGILVLINFFETDEFDTALTDASGVFSFEVDTGTNSSQICYDLFYFDCDGTGQLASDCLSQDNPEVQYDWTYCAGGVEDCQSFLQAVPIDDVSVELFSLNLGNAPFTYAWSTGETTTSVVVPFESGEYCATITDATGCITESCIDLSPPPNCYVYIYEEYFINQVNLYAEGAGADENLSYSWSTGDTGSSITINESGEYCVTMTDGTGCEAFDCRYIEVDSFFIDDCFSYINFTEDDSLGTLLEVVVFGEAPFEYLWSTGEVGVSIVPVDEGDYCVSVTDANGCMTEACTNYYVQPDCDVFMGCDPDPLEGVVHLFASGFGNEPLSYEWNTGETDQSIIVSESAEYCVTITDADGCVASTCMFVNVETVSDCFAPIHVTYLGNTAELSVTPIIEGEYSYLWSTTDSTESTIITTSGEYCVTVTNIETGCTFATCEFVFLDIYDPCDGYIGLELVSDSLAILTAINFAGVDAGSISYLWSNGATSQSIEVVEDGEYCVTMTIDEACEIDLCLHVSLVPVNFDTGVIAYYYDVESEEGLDATIEAYRVNEDSTLTFYSVLEPADVFGINGIYLSEFFETGNYIFLATPELSDIYVPSYSIATTFWDQAEVYSITEPGLGFSLPIEIQAIKITDVNGLGSIGGVVTDDQLKSDKEDDVSRSGDPLMDANIMLMHNSVVVGQEFTHEDGSYNFESLPYGTYTVVLEQPGLTRQTVEVTISEDNPIITDLVFEGESTNIKEEIFSEELFTIYPNPTAQYINLNILAVQGITQIEISGVDGRTVEKRAIDSGSTLVDTQIDVSQFEGGIYNVVVKTEGRIQTSRFIKI